MAREMQPRDEVTRTRTLSEIRATDNPEIEQVVSMDAVELEKFMHEPVEIIMHEPRDDSELFIEVIPVNGVNQPILRGEPIVIKRKYVEAIARATSSRFKQVARDTFNTDNGNFSNPNIKERKYATFPMTIIKDTPKGRAWLKAIYEAEAAAA